MLIFKFIETHVLTHATVNLPANDITNEVVMRCHTGKRRKSRAPLSEISPQTG